MTMMESADERLNQAFHLAYFIHNDREIAVRVATAAATKLEVAVASQDKRLYYVRTMPGKSRTKVFFNQPHLLQRLIYAESEQYEIQQERSGLPTSVSEEAMMTRFIKHLVRITLRRNSFYVTVGISRLLFSYSTSETMAIYGAVAQDPDRSPDDYYYRRSKKHLMEELKSRFGPLLEVCRGHHGEERFKVHDDPGRFAQLVRECLNQFTPWQTECPVPHTFDPDEIPRLTYSGENPDAGHHIEVNRIHAALHPDCFERLLAGLGLASADRRLAAPKFALAVSDDSQMPGGHHPPSDLSEEELAAIRGELAEQSRLRKTAHASLLRILVDGREQARMAPADSSAVSFEVDENAELIEVWADEPKSKVLLATHLIAHDDFNRNDEARVSTIVLEGGQKISFALRPLRDAFGCVQGASVEVAYREQSLWQLIGEWLLDSARAVGGRPFANHPKIALSAPLIASLVITLAISASLISVWFTGGSPEVARHSEDRPPAPAASASVPPPSPAVAVPDAAAPKREPNATEAGGANESLFQEPKLRSAKLRSEISAVASLLDVKRVIVRVDGEKDYQQLMREALVRSLQSQERINVTTSAREADAALKVTVERKDAAEPPAYVARMVNKPGQMLWPRNTDGHGAKYEGDVEDAAGKIVKDLINEIAMLEKQGR